MRRRSFSLIALLSLISAGPLLGSPQDDAPASPKQAVRDLADQALAAPPELAADVLLKLIERDHITDAKWKRNLLETAWSLAAKATYESEIQPAVAVFSDDDPGSLSAALATGLSTAGLQARIISQMAKLDVVQSRDMFVQMSPTTTESPNCFGDRYISRRPYFQALKTLLPTFSAEEKQSGEKFRFLSEGLRVLSNPEDFELSLELLLGDSGLAPKEFAELATSWSETLARARFADRLSSSRPVNGIAEQLLNHAKDVELRGGSIEELLRAFRSYFVRHAQSERCGESKSRAAAEEELRAAFNKRVAVVAPSIPPISADDIKPKAFGEEAKIVSFANTQNDTVREIKSDYSHLRFAGDEERETPEWNNEALQFLNKLERWSKEFGQSERETFVQKAQWYGALVYVPPDGKLRQLFLDRYVKFLASSPIEQESPPEWLSWVNRLIGAAEVPDRAAWLDQIEAAGDSTIAIYCQLARLKLDSTRGRRRH
jgi:hypothetical protein